MTRASLVAGLSLLAWYYGRKFHPVTLLALTAAVTIAVNPIQIWGDAGWYMSFLSFAGVLILAPLIKDYFWGKEESKPRVRLPAKIWDKFRRRYLAGRNFVAPKPHQPSFSLRQIFIETTSAQIMAAPIIALLMGNFSPFGIVANLVVLPILPLTMLLTFIGGVAALILPTTVASVIAWPAERLLNYIILVAQKVAEIPGASQEVNLLPAVYIAIFGLIVVAIVYMKFKTKHNFRADNIVE
jgi:competence protein ComEC